MVLSSENYTRSAALESLDAFLAGTLPLDEFRDWVDAFNWDRGQEQADPPLRTAIATLELVLHELDDGRVGSEQVRERAVDAQRLLQEAPPVGTHAP